MENIIITVPKISSQMFLFINYLCAFTVGVKAFWMIVKQLCKD